VAAEATKVATGSTKAVAEVTEVGSTVITGSTDAVAEVAEVAEVGSTASVIASGAWDSDDSARVSTAATFLSTRSLRLVAH
jgi:hypothetical protein